MKQQRYLGGNPAEIRRCTTCNDVLNENLDPDLLEAIDNGKLTPEYFIVSSKYQLAELGLDILIT